jgi:hypothetical protein
MNNPVTTSCLQFSFEIFLLYGSWVLEGEEDGLECFNSLLRSSKNPKPKENKEPILKLQFSFEIFWCSNSGGWGVGVGEASILF